jgi:hypothetical protein
VPRIAMAARMIAAAATAAAAPDVTRLPWRRTDMGLVRSRVSGEGPWGIGLSVDAGRARRQATGGGAASGLLGCLRHGTLFV